METQLLLIGHFSSLGKNQTKIKFTLSSKCSKWQQNFQIDTVGMLNIGISDFYFRVALHGYCTRNENNITYLLWNVITADTALAKILNETSMHFVSSQFLKLKCKCDTQSFISRTIHLLKHNSHTLIPRMRWEIVAAIQVSLKMAQKHSTPWHCYNLVSALQKNTTDRDTLHLNYVGIKTLITK